MDLSRYNITGKKEAAYILAKNNRRLLHLRWIYMVLVATVAIVSTAFSTGSFFDGTIYVEILIAGLVVNAILLAITISNESRYSTQRLLTLAQLVMDLSMAGVITYIEGGATARTTVLYMFPIMATALLFRGNLVMLTAAMSGATYVFAVLFEQYTRTSTTDVMHTIVPLIFYPAIFLVLARIAMYLEHVGTVESKEKAYDAFLSLVAHQLKHPASATTTIIDAMSHNNAAPLSKETMNYVDMLKAENEDQIRLIDNLLEVAPRKGNSMLLESTELATLVEKIAMRAATSNERIEDLEKMPDSLVSVNVDASQIKLSLALSNIFDNAFRYSSKGDLVRYLLEDKSDTIRLLIRDGGKGMSTEDIANQLARFEKEGIRGMEKGGLDGIGLGLFVASRIIRAHGGTLDLHSSEGVGTTVAITLPKGKQNG